MLCYLICQQKKVRYLTNSICTHEICLIW